MSYELKGKIITIGETIQVSDKFKKREIVIETTEIVNGNQYVQPIQMQAVQAKCDMLNNYRDGQNVKVQFNVKGNSYVSKKDGSTKYNTSLEVWKIDNL